MGFWKEVLNLLGRFNCREFDTWERYNNEAWGLAGFCRSGPEDWIGSGTGGIMLFWRQKMEWFGYWLSYIVLVPEDWNGSGTG